MAARGIVFERCIGELFTCLGFEVKRVNFTFTCPIHGRLHEVDLVVAAVEKPLITTWYVPGSCFAVECKVGPVPERVVEELYLNQ
ncbi:MAG: hypothetical protein DRJ40_02805 [Thermoprotei archaeon]|nr:MAG: hypothetical protein DRJ40_02805 [Thermoprotei archaeon]